MIKILLIEDHLLIREVWKDTLSQIDDFEVVGETDNAKDGYEKISNLKGYSYNLKEIALH
jgi:DNA-binding NarL/FixJ family response regulator